MNTNISDIPSLLEEVTKQQLYSELIVQLKKDFTLANVSLELPDLPSPASLKQQLCDHMGYLIQEKFADYLTLLYIIDIPESMIKAVKGNDVHLISEQVCFLILKRVWQKVWFKTKY